MENASSSEPVRVRSLPPARGEGPGLEGGPPRWVAGPSRSQRWTGIGLTGFQRAGQLETPKYPVSQLPGSGHPCRPWSLPKRKRRGEPSRSCPVVGWLAHWVPWSRLQLFPFSQTQRLVEQAGPAWARRAESSTGQGRSGYKLPCA